MAHFSMGSCNLDLFSTALIPKPALTVISNVLATIIFVITLVYHTIAGIVKAIIPWSWIPHKKIAGEVVLITGSGSGLGRELAILFAEHGAKVALWDNDPDRNSETLRTLHTAGNRECRAYTVNVADKHVVYRTGKQVLSDFGRVDFVVNCAGIVNGQPFLDCSDELIQRTIDVNLMSLIWISKVFAQSMINNRHGHMVVISSMAGKVGVAGQVDYAVSKFGAVGLAESLRAEMRQKCGDLHMTLVCPYYINTGMFAGVQSSSPMLLPILETRYAAEEILHAIRTNKPVFQLPKFTYLTMIFKVILPTAAGDAIAEYIGIHREMKSFRGRR